MYKRRSTGGGKTMLHVAAPGKFNRIEDKPKDRQIYMRTEVMLDARTIGSSGGPEVCERASWYKVSTGMKLPGNARRDDTSSDIELVPVIGPVE